jgi:hypothetical protein
MSITDLSYLFSISYASLKLGKEPETIHLLQKVYQKSKHHRVRQCAQCILLSHQGYTVQELSPIFQVDRITI